MKLLAEGGERELQGLYGDDAGRFLARLCSEMPYAPPTHTLLEIRSVNAFELGGCDTLLYSFRYDPSSMCQNAFVFLVRLASQVGGVPTY